MKKSKAYLNVLKFRLNMKLQREVAHNYPVAAFIEPNLFCNLHCPACPTGLRLDLRPTVSIEEGLFRSAIDEIGDYVFQLYMYNWGEPLLHKRTPEMIRYAKEKDIKITLSTNLSIKLTDDYIERLVTSGLDTMLVSLDGVNEETYKHYRRNGNLALVRENMMRIKRAKDALGVSTPKIVWQFLVFRHNEHEIEQARALFREWGADDISVGAAIMPLEPHDEGFAPSSFPQYNMYHPDHPVQRETERQLNSSRSCSWLYGVFVLNPNGKVSPCCAVPSEKHDFAEYQAGDKFLDVWNNDKFKRSRQLFVGWGKESKARAARERAERAAQTASSVPLVSITRKTENVARVDGMSVRASMSVEEGKLICEECPIPYLQDYTDPVITEVSADLVRGFGSGRPLSARARALFNYLLMGAPNWGALKGRGVERVANSLRYRLNPQNWIGISQRRFRKISHYIRSL